MAHESYTKCILRRETEAWIPTEYAAKRKKVRVKGKDGEWSEVWTIFQPCHAVSMHGDEVELVKEEGQRCKVCGEEIPLGNIKSGGTNMVCSAKCFDKGKDLLKEAEDED